MAKQGTHHNAALHTLREFGLRYPDAHTKSPWPGHLDLAVRDKTFAYLSVEGEPFKISCKLPHSADAALTLPFAEPTGYGLGKSSWVTATLEIDDPVPTEMFKTWIDESYRAQAPKKLVARLAENSDASKKLAATLAESPKASKTRAARSAQTPKAAKTRAAGSAPSPKARATPRTAKRKR